MLNTNINNMVKYTKAAGAQGNKVEDGDYVRYFARIEKRFNKMKKAHEEELEKVIEDFTQFKAEDYSHQATHTTIMEKALKSLISEIWEAVIPISCPHCQAKNPGFRKDGFTKLFRKPLSEKLKNTMKQQDRIKKAAVDEEEGGVEGFEIKTEPSTRKHSKTTQSEKSEDIYEDEEEEEDEELPSNQQIISPIEVKDLIEKLWRKEKPLLDLMYGRYYPVAEGEPLVSDSLGAKMFFIQKLIVPPNRFRPES